MTRQHARREKKGGGGEGEGTIERSHKVEHGFGWMCSVWMFTDTRESVPRMIRRIRGFPIYKEAEPLSSIVTDLLWLV